MTASVIATSDPAANRAPLQCNGTHQVLHETRGELVSVSPSETSVSAPKEQPQPAASNKQQATSSKRQLGWVRFDHRK